MATTADEVWQLLGELLQAQKETDRKFQETNLKFQETDRKFQETDRLQKENARLRELGKQIGGLGAKGSFTEGLALPSMETILRQQFAMEIIATAKVVRT